MPWLQVLAYTAAAFGAVLLLLFLVTLVVTLCGRGADHSPSLYASIARFYDATSALWERVWGEHMHHGWYGSDGKAVVADHRDAQIAMIDQTLRFGGVDPKWAAACAAAAADGVVRVLDAGCGVGGSARHIAQAFSGVKVDVTGVSLSPRQVASARERTQRAGLQERVHFKVANAMSLDFPDNHFDLVWSMESGEHMPDKEAFVREMTRVLKPGGRFLMATWCHRDVSDGAGLRGPLRKTEKLHLKLLCRNYCLPKWVPVSDYASAAAKCGLVGVQVDDWTRSILPFWPAVVWSALRPSSLVGLLRAGWLAVRGALTAVLMISGFRRELLVFALFTATKGTSGKKTRTNA